VQRLLQQAHILRAVDHLPRPDGRGGRLVAHAVGHLHVVDLDSGGGRLGPARAGGVHPSDGMLCLSQGGRQRKYVLRSV